MLLELVIDPRLLRRAFVASIAIHVLVAYVVPVSPSRQAQNAPVETISFVHAQRMRIERHTDSRPLPVAVPQTTRRAAVVSFARKHSELSARNQSPHSRPTPVTGPQGPIAAAPRDVAKAPEPLFARAPGRTPSDTTLQHAPAASPNPAATAAVTIAGAGLNNRGGVSPFGAEQPPVLDPRVKVQLQRLTVHVTLVITVGEDGRTKRIEFQPPLDSATEHTIQTLLADASWDAAVCGGGVSCEGVATIKL